MTDSPADDGAVVTRPVPFISRVRLKNYKSIAECDVRLGPLTILVGPNGSGKSNFLDALAFLSRAVATTPAEAIDGRGGLHEILRRVPEQTDSFSLAIEAAVWWGPLPAQKVDVSYGFEIGPPERRGLRSFEVISESCELRWGGQVWRFLAERGTAEITSPDRRPESVNFEADRLYLPVASVQQSFAPLFAGLREMRFYNFEPEIMRRPQAPTTGAVLRQTGENLGDVLGALSSENPRYKRRIDEYLRAIVPGVSSIEKYDAGQYATIALRAATGTAGEEVEFGSDSMSDGTIRAAGVLAALFQPWVLGQRVRFVGIEEPESALHPAAAGVLFDALTEASEHVQILTTSQSADLLDRDDLDASIIRPATMRDGLTIIGEVDDASREIAEKKLFTLGELMRGNQLAPQPASLDDLTPEEA
jgi:predicted ATPase